MGNLINCLKIERAGDVTQWYNTPGLHSSYHKKIKVSLYCLQQTHCVYKDTSTLNMYAQENIHTLTLSILMLSGNANIRESRFQSTDCQQSHFILIKGYFHLKDKILNVYVSYRASRYRSQKHRPTRRNCQIHDYQRDLNTPHQKLTGLRTSNDGEAQNDTISQLGFTEFST